MGGTPPFPPPVPPSPLTGCPSRHSAAEEAPKWRWPALAGSAPGEQSPPSRWRQIWGSNASAAVGNFGATFVPVLRRCTNQYWARSRSCPSPPPNNEHGARGATQHTGQQHTTLFRSSSRMPRPRHETCILGPPPGGGLGGERLATDGGQPPAGNRPCAKVTALAGQALQLGAKTVFLYIKNRRRRHVQKGGFLTPSNPLNTILFFNDQFFFQRTKIALNSGQTFLPLDTPKIQKMPRGQS